MVNSPTPTGSCLSCTEDSTSGWGAPAEVPQQRVEGQDHLPDLLNASLDAVGTLLTHVQLTIHEYPQLLFGGCALSLHLPACTDSGDCHDPGARPHTWIC